MRIRPCPSVLLASILALAAADARAADGVRITATPAQVQLGTDKAAQLVVELPSGAANLSLTTSLGSVEGLTRTGEGRYVARYLPPSWTYPQVAILTAVARRAEGGLLYGWARLPLYGQGDAVVRAKPGESITVRIGDKTFGPVEANASGVALVPVIVPPGVKLAFYGKEPVDLGVPETTRLHLAVEAKPLRADRPSDLEILVFAITPDGAPRPEGKPKVKASRGSVSALTAVEPGVYRTRWTAPAGRAGKVELTAALAGEDEQGRVAFELPPGPPAKMTLSVQPTVVVAGQTQEVRALVTLADAGGNPTSPPLTVEPAAVRVVREEPARGGAKRLFLTVDPAFGGRPALELKVRAAGTEVSATEILTLRPGPLSRLRFEAPSSVTAGGDPVKVSVRAEDAFGNPVPAPKLKVEARPGRIERIIDYGNGDFSLDYRPPAKPDPKGEVTFVAKLGALSESKVLALLPPGGLGAGVKAGALSNLGDVSAIYVAVEALWTKLPIRGLGVGAELSRFSFGPERPGVDALNQYYAVGLTALYQHAFGANFALEGRAAAALSYVRSRLWTPEQPLQVAHRWVPAAHVGVGAYRRFWRGGATAELRYGFYADPALGILRGRLSSAQVLLGYRFEL